MTFCLKLPKIIISFFSHILYVWMTFWKHMLRYFIHFLAIMQKFHIPPNFHHVFEVYWFATSNWINIMYKVCPAATFRACFSVSWKFHSCENPSSTPDFRSSLARRSEGKRNENNEPLTLSFVHSLSLARHCPDWEGIGVLGFQEDTSLNTKDDLKDNLHWRLSNAMMFGIGLFRSCLNFIKHLKFLQV